MNDEIITSYLLGKKAGGGTPPVYQDKEVSITQNGTTTITKDSGYDALSSVELTVAVPQPSGKINITQNGTDIDVSSYASADVSVAGAWAVPLGTRFENSTFTSISGLDTSSLINMNSLFKNCQSLTTAPDISFASGLYFENTFLNCRNIVNIDYSNTQFSQNAWYFGYMFQNCSNLETIDLSSIGQLTTTNFSFQYMFSGCSKLKTVNLSNLSTPQSSGLNTMAMFNNCSSLEEIDMSNFDFTRIGLKNDMFFNVPTNCLIYVKDQTQVDWFTTNFSDLTNVQIKS